MQSDNKTLGYVRDIRSVSFVPISEGTNASPSGFDIYRSRHYDGNLIHNKSFEKNIDFRFVMAGSILITLDASGTRSTRDTHQCADMGLTQCRRHDP